MRDRGEEPRRSSIYQSKRRASIGSTPLTTGDGYPSRRRGGVMRVSFDRNGGGGGATWEHIDEE